MRIQENCQKANKQIVFASRKISPRIIRKYVMQEKTFDAHKYLKNKSSFKRFLVCLTEIANKVVHLASLGQNENAATIKKINLQLEKIISFWSKVEDVDKNPKFAETFEKLARSGREKDRYIAHEIRGSLGAVCNWYSLTSCMLDKNFLSKPQKYSFGRVVRRDVWHKL